MSELHALEQKVALERRALSRALDQLSSTLAPERVMQEAATQVEAWGGEIGRQTWTAARKNPAAFALMGSGIALLLAGNGSRAEPARKPTQSVPPREAMHGFDKRLAKADSAIKEEMTGMMDEAPSAARLSAALNRGLDRLPPDARDRVIAARKTAIRTQEQIEARARKAARASSTFVHDQPLAAGALALGLGALIGALLPNTRREDELLGARRDALMQRAHQALSEEMDKLHAAASNTLEQRQAKSGSTQRAG